MKQLDEQGIWKERTSAERARIIEDNDEALKERIRMISNAKEEVILSTFDFRSDDSGKLMLGALIDAADRGVSVNVIVDGVSGFTKMKGNPDFKALASSDNAALAAGGAILCSQYIGSSNPKGANRAARQVFLVMTVLSVLISAICLAGYRD